MILANKMTLVRNMALVSEKTLVSNMTLVNEMTLVSNMKIDIICANYITTINERA